MMICEHCNKQFNGKVNRSFCYECMPEGLSQSERQSLRRKFEREKNPLILNCPICNKEFIVPLGEKNRKYCFSCIPKGLSKKEQAMIINRAAKKKAVDLLGGKCIICGFDKYLSALDFHHLIESDKEFNLSHKICSIEFDETIIKELMKCVVLCSNCHRAVHAGEIILNDSIDIKR